MKPILYILLVTAFVAVRSAGRAGRPAGSKTSSSGGSSRSNGFLASSGLSGGSYQLIRPTPPPVYGHDFRPNPQLANARLATPSSNIQPNYAFLAPSGLSGGSSRIVVTTPPPTIARGNSLPGSNSPIYGHDSRANPQLANERFLPRLSNIPPNHRVLVTYDQRSGRPAIHYLPPDLSITRVNPPTEAQRRPENLY